MKKKSKKKNIKLSYSFDIAETESFQKTINKPEFKSLYFKLKNYVYPQLKNNPFFGTHIKKLKGKLNNFYRYRIGKYRLFYIIDSKKVIVFIITISHRKDSY